MSFLSVIQASLLQEKIENFIGTTEYNTQKNLIAIVFSDEKSFENADAKIDELKVLEQLKRSGLLKLFYTAPVDLTLSFFTQHNPVIFMRVINETLLSMGYNYFITKRVLKDTKGLLWEIGLSTEHVVDPIYLAKRLELRGCFLEKIEKKSKNEWYYQINSDHIEIQTQDMQMDTTTTLNKPIKPYWIKVEGVSSLSFRSKIADKWFPNIVFFDTDLQVIKDYKKHEVTNSLKIQVPQGAKYAKVNDIYTLDNIKRGLSVYLKSKN